MSLGASIYSTNVISWEEFADFVHSLKSELPEVMISVESQSHYPEVGFYKNKEWALFVLHDHLTDPEHLLEEMSRIRGILQKTVIIIDMNSLDLAQTFVRAFAQRYPCLFQFGGQLQDNQELLRDVGTYNT